MYGALGGVSVRWKKELHLSLGTLNNSLAKRLLTWGIIGAATVFVFDALFDLAPTYSWFKHTSFEALIGVSVGGVFGGILHLFLRTRPGAPS